MQRSEKIGLGIAAAGHVLLFGVLSLHFLDTPNPASFNPPPVQVQFVDKIGLETAAPKVSMEDMAASTAPDLGPTENTPPPAEAVPEPEPEPTPAPVEKTPDEPAPKPVEKAPEKPAPKPKPKASEPTKETPKKATPKKAEKKPAPEKSSGNKKSEEKPKKARGSKLGPDFLKGITTDQPTKGKATTPQAANVSASAVASIADAIAAQIQPCANRQVNPGPGANEITTKLRLKFNRNGSLAAKPTLMGQTGITDENKRYAQRVADLAINSVVECAPIKDLPAEYYEKGWRDIAFRYKLP